MNLTEEILKKWGPVLEHPDLPGIEDAHRRGVTATILENTENALREAQAQMGNQSLLAEAAPTNSTGTSVDNFDPLIQF
jgi:hypothetical protein